MRLSTPGLPTLGPLGNPNPNSSRVALHLETKQQALKGTEVGWKEDRI